jgi:hypothetical protein
MHLQIGFKRLAFNEVSFYNGKTVCAVHQQSFKCSKISERRLLPVVKCPQSWVEEILKNWQFHVLHVQH